MQLTNLPQPCEKATLGFAKVWWLKPLNHKSVSVVMLALKGFNSKLLQRRHWPSRAAAAPKLG